MPDIPPGVRPFLSAADTPIRPPRTYVLVADRCSTCGGASIYLSSSSAKLGSCSVCGVFWMEPMEPIEPMAPSRPLPRVFIRWSTTRAALKNIFNPPLILRPFLFSEKTKIKVLEVMHKFDCVAMFLSGHRHRETYFQDEKEIHHVSLAAALEAPPGQVMVDDAWLVGGMFVYLVWK